MDEDTFHSPWITQHIDKLHKRCLPWKIFVLRIVTMQPHARDEFVLLTWRKQSDTSCSLVTGKENLWNLAAHGLLYQSLVLAAGNFLRPSTLIESQSSPDEWVMMWLTKTVNTWRFSYRKENTQQQMYCTSKIRTQGYLCHWTIIRSHSDYITAKVDVLIWNVLQHSKRSTHLKVFHHTLWIDWCG